MKILILTQNDPFFLADNIDYLLHNLPSGCSVAATVLFDASPYGKRMSYIKKAIDTIKIFGIVFFFRYSIKLVFNKINPSKSVRNILIKYGIPIINLKNGINHKSSIEKIKKYKPDLLISIAGNQIFGKEVINIAPKGCLNLHSALLPKYRGLMPSFWVLKNKENETGVSVFFVDEGIDSGDIIVQKKINLKNIKSQEELILESKKIGMDAILESINIILEGNYKLIVNEDDNMTYYNFPTRNDVKEFLNDGNRFF